MCAFGGWGGVCTRRGDIQSTQGEHCGGIKTANTPPLPAGVQRFDSTKRTPRVVIPPPPHRSAEKMQNGSFITSPNRAPAETQRSGFGGKRTSDRERESCRLRRDEGFVVRSDDSQHRICLVCGEAAALPNAPSGQSPAPNFRAEARTHQAASVSAETLLPASGGAASKGDQSPFEEPPALRGDERNHFRKVIDYEKRYQIQHAHGVRRP